MLSLTMTLALQETEQSTRQDTQHEANARPALQVVVLRDAHQLAAHVAAWDELARTAAESNVFYESWQLLPAIKAMGSHSDLRFVLLYDPKPPGSAPGAPPQLCAFFPLEKLRRYKGLPVGVLSLWKHVYCSTCTPLLRAGRERECLGALLDFLRRDGESAPLFELRTVPAEGNFQRYWIEACQAHHILTFTEEIYTRALLQPVAHGGSWSPEEYLRAALTRKRRKELKRLENRLTELGPLSYEALENPDDAPRWIEEFLQIEAGGWKGRAGTAFASGDADRAYFKAIACEAATRGRLMLLALRLNGRPIAMKVNFLAGNCAFTWKIAFDEEYARFSPGVLLELENIRRLPTLNNVSWMDSCAKADHFMINRLWMERRLMQNSVISTGKTPGDLIVSLLPLLRWVKRQRKRRKAATPGNNSTLAAATEVGEEQ